MNSCKIISTTISEDKGNLQFFTADGSTTGSKLRMTISDTGNVNIGSQTPNNIFQVGDGGKLRISNGVSDYSLIGTKDDVNDNTTNTKIFINGNTCTYAGAPGFIQYFATGTGGHVCYVGNSEKMRITSTDNVDIGSSSTDYSTNTKKHLKGASYGYRNH